MKRPMRHCLYLVLSACLFASTASVAASEARTLDWMELLPPEDREQMERLPELMEELASGPAEVWTEDGTLGREGLVTEGIELEDDPLLLGCGPDPMLRALADLARRRDADLQVSVEEHMGCGVGTCQGCVVRSADGRWVKSCVEGPVFDARSLDWSVPHA